MNDLEKLKEQVATLTRQRDEQIAKHATKDRAYLEELNALKAQLEEQGKTHRQVLADLSTAHAKQKDQLKKDHEAELNRKDERHAKAIAAALAETPEARAQREKIAAIHKKAVEDAHAVAAEFQASAK